MNGLPIRTGHPNRRVGLLYWLGEHVIETEDGQHLEASLTESFWRNCSELRYGQVGRWLQANGLAGRANGQPPCFDLRQIGTSSRFRLAVISR
jgi:hypothetical protein